jgi:hypothetical protein
MLAEFVVFNRETIISRCRAKVAGRSAPLPTKAEIDHGVPMFLDELIDSLSLNLPANPDIAETATKHGQDLLRRGFTPSQVVHDYGDICQTVTEMVIETQTSISADDFRQLNRCLDDAIAAAITEYQRSRDVSASGKVAHEGNRIRVLGDGLRASVRAARVAFEAIHTGTVGLGGSTGLVLVRSLQATEDLNERLQAEVAAFAKP